MQRTVEFLVWVRKHTFPAVCVLQEHLALVLDYLRHELDARGVAISARMRVSTEGTVRTPSHASVLLVAVGRLGSSCDAQQDHGSMHACALARCSLRSLQIPCRQTDAVFIVNVSSCHFCGFWSAAVLLARVRTSSVFVAGDVGGVCVSCGLVPWNRD